MPRYRRTNNRNALREEPGIHVAELIEESDLMNPISLGPEVTNFEDTESSDEVTLTAEEISEQETNSQDFKAEEAQQSEVFDKESKEDFHAKEELHTKEELQTKEVILNNERNVPIMDVRDSDMQNIPLPSSMERDEGSRAFGSRRGTDLINSAINYSNVRVLNVAAGYDPLFVIIGNKTIATDLSFGKVSPYERIIDGFRTVMVFSGTAPRTPLITTVIPFIAGTRITLAVLNTTRGLQLLPIHDNMCAAKSRERACFRAANLTFDDGPFDITLDNGSMVFSDINVKEVTQWKQAIPGDYEFYVLETPVGAMPATNNEHMQFMPQREGAYQFSFYLRMLPDTMYTAYIIGGYYTTVPIQVIIVEN